jgi:hypothetical protein
VLLGPFVVPFDPVLPARMVHEVSVWGFGYCMFGLNKITYLRYRNRDQDLLCFFFVTMTIPSTRLLCSGWQT